MNGVCVSRMTPDYVRRYGLGQAIIFARQKAINRVLGQPQGSGRFHFGSMPFVTESAFEYLQHRRAQPTDVAKASFEGFSRPGAELETHYVYQRLNGPNDTALDLTLQEVYSALSGRRHLGAVVSNNGMSAFTGLLGLLSPGDTLLHHPILYGCHKSKIATYLRPRKIKCVPYRFENLRALERRMLTDRSLRMMVTETELNPNLEMPPLDKIAEVVNRTNMKRMAKGWRPVIFWVDNTFPSFATLDPFAFGVHVAAESLTKFVCGTGEEMGGVTVIDLDIDHRVGKKNYDSLFASCMMRQKDDGLSMSPFPAWDVLRLLPSIEMRRDRIQQTAQKVAEWLKGQPGVAAVNFPGLMEDQVQNDRAHRFMLDEKKDFLQGLWFILF